ncbi:hypothetical protein [Dyadobacter alkalitolerans]|uniref:hypothetical protein n=1 Tax=Dyadobacter alkalitolerans TaxID=492736 RepID=UPI0012F9F7D7|nr:hypothetical protein [Dyadobacter alkalitolerans]
MSAARRERRKMQRQQAKPLKQLVDLTRQQQELESQFASTFRDYGLDPYGKDSEQFQMALKTHKVK